MLFPSALAQAIRLGDALRIRHAELHEEVVIFQFGVVTRIGDERVLDDDAGDAHFTGICDHAVIIPQTSIGIPAIVARVPDLNTAILQAKRLEFLEDVLAQLLAGLVSFLVIAAAAGIEDLGSIRGIPIAAVGIDMDAHENLGALVYRSLHAQPQTTIAIIGIFVLRTRENDRHARVIFELGFARLGNLPCHVGFLEPIRGRTRICSTVPWIERDNESTRTTHCKRGRLLGHDERVIEAIRGFDITFVIKHVDRHRPISGRLVFGHDGQRSAFILLGREAAAFAVLRQVDTYELFRAILFLDLRLHLEKAVFARLIHLE